jgi:hypothetical protein
LSDIIIKKGEASSSSAKRGNTQFPRLHPFECKDMGLNVSCGKTDNR